LTSALGTGRGESIGWVPDPELTVRLAADNLLCGTTDLRVVAGRRRRAIIGQFSEPKRTIERLVSGNDDLRQLARHRSSSRSLEFVLDATIYRAWGAIALTPTNT
jgi:hypothetical protein